MPKGQYQRKPKVIGAEHVVPDVSPPTIAELNKLAEAEPERYEVLLNVHKTLDKLQSENAAHEEFLRRPPAEPARETFDDWMEADAPVMPANDRVTQMVGEWASSFCPLDHFATWLPTADSQGIVVTLNTAHGTSELTRSAGQWREDDITAALASMRTELGV